MTAAVTHTGNGWGGCPIPGGPAALRGAPQRRRGPWVGRQSTARRPGLRLPERRRGRAGPAGAAWHGPAGQPGTAGSTGHGLTRHSIWHSPGHGREQDGPARYRALPGVQPCPVHGTARYGTARCTALSGTRHGSLHSPARHGTARCAARPGLQPGPLYSPARCTPAGYTAPSVHGRFDEAQQCPAWNTPRPRRPRSPRPAPAPPHPTAGVTGGRPSAGRLGAAPGRAGCGVAKSRRSVSGWPPPAGSSAAAETIRRCGEALPSSAASPAAPPAAAMAHMAAGAAGAAGGAAGRARTGARPMAGAGPLRSSSGSARLRCAPAAGLFGAPARAPLRAKSFLPRKAARAAPPPAHWLRPPRRGGEDALPLAAARGAAGGAARPLAGGGRADRRPISGAEPGRRPMGARLGDAAGAPRGCGGRCLCPLPCPCLCPPRGCPFPCPCLCLP